MRKHHRFPYLSILFSAIVAPLSVLFVFPFKKLWNLNIFVPVYFLWLRWDEKGNTAPSTSLSNFPLHPHAVFPCSQAKRAAGCLRLGERNVLRVCCGCQELWGDSSCPVTACPLTFIFCRGITCLCGCWRNQAAWTALKPIRLVVLAVEPALLPSQVFRLQWWLEPFWASPRGSKGALLKGGTTHGHLGSAGSGGSLLFSLSLREVGWLLNSSLLILEVSRIHSSCVCK